MQALLALAAFAVVSTTLFRTNGHYDPIGVVCIVAALGLLFAAMAPWPAIVQRVAERALPAMLLLVVELQLCLLTLKLPGIYLTPGVSLTPFSAGLALAGVLAATYLFGSAESAGAKRSADLRLGALVALFLLLGAWMINASPRPFIDVWYYQQRAAQALLSGDNPYAITYPNIYGHTSFIDPSLLKDGRVQYHMYPPLSVILTLPGYLLGDARYSLIGATAASAVLLVASLRRMKLAPGHPAELAAVALMFHARGFFLVEQAWTEPFMVLGVCALTWALTGPAPRSLIAALFLSAKQYSIFWIPALMATRRLTRRELVLGIAGAALIAAPFFFWSPEGLWHGLVLFQIRQPFRDDALSVLAAVHRLYGVELPSLVGFAAAALAMAISLLWIRRRRSRSLGDAALSGAVVYLAFFAFNKQAFFNYYWFSGAMILVAVATSAAEGSRAAR